MRTSGDYALEEDLFSKLLFLHRSPETLIEVTRLSETQPKLERWDDGEVYPRDDRKVRSMRARLLQTLPMWHR